MPTGSARKSNEINGQPICLHDLQDGKEGIRERIQFSILGFSGLLSAP